MVAIGALVISFFTVITNPFSLNVNSADWKCDAAEWDHGPVIEDGAFKGTLHVVCDITSKVQTYDHLRRHVENEVFAESKKLISGPTEDVYNGLNGVRYDVVVEQEHEGIDAEIRGHFHIVNDKTKMIAQFHSDAVIGGDAKGYLTKADIGYTISTTRGLHTVVLSTTTHVDVPTGFSEEAFKQEVKTQAEKALRREVNNAIPDIVDHLN